MNVKYNYLTPNNISVLLLLSEENYTRKELKNKAHISNDSLATIIFAILVCNRKYGLNDNGKIFAYHILSLSKMIV